VCSYQDPLNKSIARNLPRFDHATIHHSEAPSKPNPAKSDMPAMISSVFERTGCLSAAHASTTPAKMAATLNRTHIRSPTIIHFNDGPKELIADGLNTEKLKTTLSVAPSTTFSRHFRRRSAPARSFQPQRSLLYSEDGSICSGASAAEEPAKQGRMKGSSKNGTGGPKNAIPREESRVTEAWK
jgi:hypothetical protein